MNSLLKYFYNISNVKIIYHNNYYSFNYQGYAYKLYMLEEIIDDNFLINVNKNMLGSTLVSEIIFNNDRKIISSYNNKQYLLIKIFVNPSKNISLEEINYLSNSLTTKRLNINWGLLWSRKIDYLEDLINENGKKYPIITDSFNYFVGLAENAISYYNNVVIENDYTYFINHKAIRIDDTIESLYNPLNIIFDYRVRDVAEYIKISFFRDNKNVFNELNAYLINNQLTLTDIKLLIARLLYPSFYFELYEDILVNNNSELILASIIDKTSEYEKYLASVINYLRRWYDVDEILWLKN